MITFLLGFYIAAALATFLVVGFGTILEGDGRNLWKPFVYGPLWIIFIPLSFFVGIM